jgi:hypothetical protein
MIVENTTLSMGDSPQRLAVFLAADAHNSIAKMRKIVAAFRKSDSSPSSAAHRSDGPRRHLHRSRIR